MNENETITKKVTINEDMVDWESEVYDPDRQMGAEIVLTGTATVDIENEEHTIIWTVYEYPEGIKNSQEIDTGDLTLIKDINW